MAAHCRALDWAATPLGPVEGWPQSLRTAAGMVLGSAFPSIVCWGPELVQIYNDGYIAVHGAKHPWGLGRPTSEVWPEVWHLNGPLFARAQAGETVALTDAPYTLARGGLEAPPTDVFVSLSFSPVPDEAGAVGGVVVTLIDTSADVRNRALQAEREAAAARFEAQALELERSNRRLHDQAAEIAERAAQADAARRVAEAERARASGILEAMADAYFALDGEFRIVAVNAAMERSTGLAREALLGRVFWDMFPGTVGTAYERHYRAAASEGAEAHFTDAYDDGRLALVSEADVYPVAGGGVAVFWRDITPRVRAEAELRASEERLRLAVAATSVGVFDWNLATDRVVVNARFREMFGLPAGEEVIGAAMMGGVVHPEDRAAVEATLAAALDPRSTGAYRFEHRAVTPSGEIWILTFGQVFFAGEGDRRHAVRVIGNELDVTERKRADAERERLLAESDAARLAREAAHAQLQEQALELELSNQQLQDQAAEMEAQAVELQEATAALEARTAAAERAARALAESEARLRFAVEAARLGTWTWDLATDAATFDAQVRELFAFGDGPEPRADILATRVHPEDRARVGAALAAAADPAGDGRYAAEYRVVRPDGTERWAQAAGVMTFAGEGATRRPVRLLGTVLDVTEREAARRDVERLLAESERARAEAEAARAALAASEVQFRTLADAIPTLAWTAKPDGHIDWYNARWYEYTGTAPEQMEGWGWQAVHDPAELPWVLERWQAGIASGEPVEMTFPLRGADGGFRPFLTRIVPLRDADGRVVRWFGTNTDVTPEREAREAAERARAAAEAANRAKGDFLSTMSHELRTPLNAIGGYAELMELGLRGPVTDQQRADLGRIQASQRHLLGLVNEVLDLAKVDAGELRVERAAVRAGDTVDAALALVRPQAAAKGLLLSEACEGAADRPYLGDEPRVRQVLANLLANAVKFTRPGGRVAVSCALSDAPPAGAALVAGTPYVALRVEDTGVGIPEGQRERIFEPFTQAQDGANPYTRPAGGTGLGLAISRRLARLMGGDLTLESAEGHGSAFTLWLPTPERRGEPRPTPAGGMHRAARHRSQAAPPPHEAAGLVRIGAALAAEAGPAVRAWVVRLRADAAIPTSPGPGRPPYTDLELEDHAATFVTDVGLAVRTLGDGGSDAAALLRDGTAILALVAERHGAQRARLGWPEAAVEREFAILAQVLGDAVARLAGPADAPAAERAAGTVAQLLAQAARRSLGGFRLATGPGDAPASQSGAAP
jgi:PAS domain S-box-containing protein